MADYNMSTVRYLDDERPELQLITDSYEVDHIKDMLDIGEDFDTLFVDTYQGDYIEVWGMYGKVPTLGKTVYQVIAPDDEV